MSLQTYRYQGPVSGATLKHNGKDLDVRLHPNHTVQLPEHHEYTQTLLGLGYLTTVQGAPDAPPSQAGASVSGKSGGNRGASK